MLTLLDRINLLFLCSSNPDESAGLETAILRATTSWETRAAERADRYAYPKPEAVQKVFRLERDFSYLKRIAHRGVKL